MQLNIDVSSCNCSQLNTIPIIWNIGEEFFPSKKDISSSILTDIEEERRLFYVGVTRCQNDLILNFNKNGKLSQFLTELNSDLFNQTGECVYIQEFGNISNDQYKFELPNIDISVTSLIKRLNGILNKIRIV